MDRFASISLSGWRQFANVDIQFDSSLCVLTGPNGCGKTTILNVLGRHFGWNIQFVSTPYFRKGKKFWTDVDAAKERDLEVSPQAVQVGLIRYVSGQECQLHAPPTDQAQYALQYSNEAPVVGINIPSHRPIANYFRIHNIPTDPRTNQQHFQEFQSLLQQVYGSENVRNPGTVLKQSLIALALFGYGNEAVQPNPEYLQLFIGFQEILRKLLPRALGFQRLEIRNPDIVLITESGQFPLDAMSGGVSAVFGIAWQIFMYGVGTSNCTVLIDEPENHLHPSMQREFLPALRSAFPGYQFIVATHSPFIVSSAADATVYALLYGKPVNDEVSANAGSVRKIYSQRLKEADLAASPNKILRDILDVPTTLPIWVESRVREVIDRYRGSVGDEQAADAAYKELQDLGLTGDLGDLPDISAGLP
jgi:predicted ATPase